jgi:spore coat protein U-like protein
MAAAVVVISGAAQATDSGSSNLAVSASISPECNVQQNTAISFNNLSMLTGVAQSTTDDIAAGSIDAICTNGTPSPTFRYTSPNGAFQLKGSTDATQLIGYSLYQTADASGSPVTYSTDVAHPDFTPDGSAHTLALSARITPSEKNGKSMQSYTDTIVVTTAFTL